MKAVIPDDGIEPGLYAAMPEEVYHGSSALGSTDIRRLLVGPSEFHAFWSGNPECMSSDVSDALTFGRAVHRLILEGQQSFDAAFICRPEGPDVLCSAEDLRRWLRANGLSDKGVKDAMAERILSVSPSVKIADRIIERAEADGKAVLPWDAYKRIVTASAYITKNPKLERSFTGGQSEVSVFFIRDGIRCKARFDYLKVIQWEDRRTAMVVDLKSFSTKKNGQPIAQAVRETAASYRHQAAHYLAGLRHAQRHIRDGAVHGDVDIEWLNRIATAQASLFSFVFFRNSGAPYAQAQLISPQNPLMEIANRDIERALDTFRSYFAQFGHDGPWIPLDDPEELSMDDLPRYLI